MIINGDEIIFEGKRRYYVEDLSARKYNYDNTTPHLFKINDYEIAENSWVEMVRSIVTYLRMNYPEKNGDLLSFKTNWSKSDIISRTERTNFRKIDENLFVNCNHTSLHSVWLIQDFLTYYGINVKEVYLLIYRPPTAESKEARAFFEKKTKEEFGLFLKELYNKTDDKVKLIIGNIDKSMNSVLAKLSNSYDNFFLFDNYANLCNYLKDVWDDINQTITIPEKNKTMIKRYSNYLREFYRI